jgi:hypothetical protein
MMHVIEVASCGSIYLPSFMEIATGIQAILRFCLSSLNGCDVGVADEGGFMMYAVEIGPGSMMYIPSSMTVGSGIQVTWLIL